LEGPVYGRRITKTESPALNPHVKRETLEFRRIAARENWPVTGFYGQACSRFTNETGRAI
jgi:hypothetical protein